MSTFSNGFEWESWATNWCYRCVHEPACKLLETLFIEEETPDCWTPGTDDLHDRYHCPKFELCSLELSASSGQVREGEK